MKITDVETFVVGNPWKNWTFLVLKTDEGIEGLGEATVALSARTVAATVEELSQFIVGRDPREIDSICRPLVLDLRTGPVHNAMLAGLEMACLDIVGQADGEPVNALLSDAPPVEHLPLYANGWYQGPREPESFARKAGEVVARGYRALKFDPFGSSYRHFPPGEIDLAIDIVAAVRDAVGPDVGVCIEGHWRFTREDAVAVARRIEQFDPLWFEEPVPSQEIEDLVWIRERVNVPLATGEHLLDPGEFRRLLDAGVCDYVQPDILHVGGLRPTIEIGRLAAERGVKVAPHQSEGPIASVANIQLSSVLPGFHIQEMFDEFALPWRSALLDHPVEIEAGSAIVPRRPGLGIRLNRKEVARHPYAPNGYLPLFEDGWEKRNLGNK